MVTMTNRNRKHLLWAINAALASGIAVACVVALVPPHLDADQDGARKDNLLAGTDGVPPLGLRGDYDVIAKRDVRRALYDRKAVTITPPPPKKFPAKLLGTVTDPGFSSALFRTAKGQQELVSVGGQVDGATVLKIAKDAVLVKFDDRELTIKKEPSR